MKDILDFIRDSIESGKERLKNPFLLYYILFAVIMHWKAVSLFAFSTDPIEKRIFRIERLYRNWTQADFFWQSVLMLIIVLIINIGLPYVMWLFDAMHILPNNKRKSLLHASNSIDRMEELEKTKHDFSKNKIISGNVEAEDFNKRVETLQNTIEENRKSHQSEVDLILKTNEEQLNSLRKQYDSATEIYQKEIDKKNKNLSLLQGQILQSQVSDIDSDTTSELMNYYNSLDNSERKDLLYIMDSLERVMPEGNQFPDKFMKRRKDMINYLLSQGIIAVIDIELSPFIFRLTLLGKQTYKLFKQSR